MKDRALLSLPEDATRADAKRRFREMAQRLHPDHGGDPVEFHKVRQAYKRLMQRLPDGRACAECEGVGSVRVGRGFQQFRARCNACKGKGTL